MNVTTEDILGMMLDSRVEEKAHKATVSSMAGSIARAGHMPTVIETRLSEAGRKWYRGGCICREFVSKPSPDPRDVVWAQIVHLWSIEVAA